MISLISKVYCKVVSYQYSITSCILLKEGKHQPLVNLTLKFLPYCFHNWNFINLLRKVQKNKSFESVSKEDIQRSINAKFGFGPLMDLYVLCFSYGKTEYLKVIRSEAFIALNKNHGSAPEFIKKQYFKNKVLSLIELRDFSTVESFFNECSFDDLGVEFLYSIYFQLPQENRTYIRLPELQLDSNFKNLIKDKTVAVIGPAVSCIEAGDEIDGFDVVIRINYKGNNYFGDPSINGTHIDVTYYNLGTTNNLDFQILNGKLFCYVVPFNSIENHYLGGAVRERRYSPALVNGVPNMIQNIVFDVLLHSPSRLKIFNCDFYVGEAIYDESYIGKSTKLSLANLAVHDQWSQICFIKNLYLNQKIEVDSSCQRVLKMSFDEYFSILKSKFDSPINKEVQ